MFSRVMTMVHWCMCMRTLKHRTSKSCWPLTAPLEDLVKHRQGLGAGASIFGSAAILTEGQAKEAGGVYLALHCHGFAILREAKVDMASRLVRGVLIEELHPTSSGFQQPLAGDQATGAGRKVCVRYGIVDSTEHPHLASLQPNMFAGVVHLAVVVEVVEEAAMLAVNRVLQPKGQHRLVQTVTNTL